MLPRWITTAYLLYLAAPIALLFIGSFGDLWLNTLLPRGATLKWYAEVSADPSFRRAFVASLLVALTTCAACVAIGLPLAYAVFHARSARIRALARVLYQLPVALPALVLAFGFILVFSSDTLPWLGSFWLLVAGHIVLGLPYFLQTVVADMQRLGLRALEDAAESLGGTALQRFLHIVLPSLRHSVLSGIIIVAALSIGEFQFSNLVSGFLNRTYPVVLLQAFYGATGFACAATVILLALALATSVAGALTARGASRGARGGAAGRGRPPAPPGAGGRMKPMPSPDGQWSSPRRRGPRIVGRTSLDSRLRGNDEPLPAAPGVNAGMRGAKAVR
jgi:putative spermidine/putrescine transport system permease protein